MRRRMLALAIVFAICLGAILVRLVDLQVTKHDDLRQRAERQHLRSIVLQPGRGQILDRRGRALALSIHAYSVYANTDALAKTPGAAKALARVLDLPPAAVRKRIRRKRSFVWLKRQIDPQAASRVRKLNLPGIGLLTESRRFYPKRTLAGALLGFVGVDGKGLEGVEFQFDSYLRGRKRTIVVVRDAAGRRLRMLDTEQSEPPRGYDIVLTLDEAIQTAAERELARQVRHSNASSGTILVLDSQNGAILAMAQEPPFNPNDFENANPNTWRNRAITDSYEPGSTFKVVMATAALELGRANPTDLFFAEGGAYRVGGIVIHDHKPYRWLSFAQVLQKSSNIGAVKIAQLVGRKGFSTVMRRFGFGELSGVDLAGEAPGLLRPLKEWSSSSIGALAIGQEIGVTPLQLAVAYAAIANGGELVRPHILLEVRRGRDGIHRTERHVVRRVMSNKTSATLRRILRGVVTKGTGSLAAVEGYAVAGKTGTAQKVDPELTTYVKGKYVSSFIGFAPAEKPRFVILVILDEPQGVYYGGKVAAPVFSRLAREVLYYVRAPSHLMTRSTIPHQRRDRGRSAPIATAQTDALARFPLVAAVQQFLKRTAGALLGQAPPPAHAIQTTEMLDQLGKGTARASR